MSKHDNPKSLGTAFGGFADNGTDVVNGMSLRDWLAGQALTALLNTCTGKPKMSAEDLCRIISETAYEMADGMLEAREKAK